jgi:hypothetical protein
MWSSSRFRGEGTSDFGLVILDFGLGSPGSKIKNRKSKIGCTLPSAEGVGWGVVVANGHAMESDRVHSTACLPAGKTV